MYNLFSLESIDDTVVEASIDAFTTDTSEIDNLNNNIDNALAATEDLSTYQDMVSKDTISNDALDAVSVAVESLRYQLAFPNKSLSLESYSSDKRIALENAITDTAKKVWEAIKKAIAKAIAWVKQFYNKLFDNKKKLEKKLKNLLEKKLDSKEYKDVKITGKLLSVLSSKPTENTIKELHSLRVYLLDLLDDLETSDSDSEIMKFNKNHKVNGYRVNIFVSDGVLSMNIDADKNKEYTINKSEISNIDINNLMFLLSKIDDKDYKIINEKLENLETLSKSQKIENVKYAKNILKMCNSYLPKIDKIILEYINACSTVIELSLK